VGRYVLVSVITFADAEPRNVGGRSAPSYFGRVAIAPTEDEALPGYESRHRMDRANPCPGS